MIVGLLSSCINQIQVLLKNSPEGLYMAEKKLMGKVVAMHNLISKGRQGSKGSDYKGVGQRPGPKEGSSSILLMRAIWGQGRRDKKILPSFPSSIVLNVEKTSGMCGCLQLNTKQMEVRKDIWLD